MLVGIVLSALSLRTAVTVLTPLLDTIGAEFGFGSTIIGVFGTAPTAAFAAFGAVTPSVAHRIGLERTALVAMLLAAAGSLTRAMTDQTWTLLLLSLVALGGMGMGNVVLPPLVKRYFGDRVGPMSTAYIVALQVGTMIPALLAVPVANLAGWRVSIGSWALLAAAAAVPWVVVLLAERRQGNPLRSVHDRAVTGTDEAPELADHAPSGRVWRSPIAWGLATMFGMTSLITYSLFTWLPKILVDAGASPAFGGAMVAMFAGIGLGAALVMPAIAVRMANPFPVVVGCGVLFCAGFVGLYLAPMHLTVLWILAIGLGPSTFPMSLTMINLRTRTPGGSAALSGFSQGVGYTVACLGPVLFGVLHEMTGSWLAPFALLGAAVLAMVVGGFAACRPRMLEDTW